MLIPRPFIPSDFTPSPYGKIYTAEQIHQKKKEAGHIKDKPRKVDHGMQSSFNLV